MTNLSNLLHSSRTLSSRVGALTDTLVSVSHLAAHLEGAIAELDTNPLAVLPEGRGVKALDALITLQP